MKTRQVIALLIGTVSMLILLAILLSPPALALTTEPSTGVLSAYLEDSAFLIKCAKEHPAAFATQSVIAPEIQLLLAAEACAE